MSHTPTHRWNLAIISCAVENMSLSSATIWASCSLKYPRTLSIFNINQIHINIIWCRWVLCIYHWFFLSDLYSLIHFRAYLVTASRCLMYFSGYWYVISCCFKHTICIVLLSFVHLKKVWVAIFWHVSCRGVLYILCYHTPKLIIGKLHTLSSFI